MKKCSKCKDDKEDDDFYKDKRTKSGLKSWCKSCCNTDTGVRDKSGIYNELRKVYRKKHANELKIKHKQYFEENRDKILKNNSNWRQTINGRYKTYVSGAKNRNINWSLTKEEFSSFWGKNCTYCGEEINGIGIDRINSNIGYTVNNIVSCCTQCNMIKRDYSYEEFILNVKKIHDNLKL